MVAPRASPLRFCFCFLPCCFSLLALARCRYAVLFLFLIAHLNDSSSCTCLFLLHLYLARSRSRLLRLQKKKRDRARDERIFYLALPPFLFGDAVQHIRQECWSNSGFGRVVVEKPFGWDLQEARKLCAQLSQRLDESQIFASTIISRRPWC